MFSINPLHKNVLNGTQLKVSGAANGTRFENRDGDVAILLDHKSNLLMALGYKDVVEIRGKFGMSGLGIHMRCYDSIGVVAFTRPDSKCAFVLCSDGTFTSGSFMRHLDGTFSLS